jgi:hypothetical protein
MDMPNFSDYSLDELYDSLKNIDKEKYPDRVKLLKKLIAEKTKHIEGKKYKQSDTTDSAGQQIWFKLEPDS